MGLEKFVKEDMAGVRDAYLSSRKQERYADSRLVAYAQEAMTERLHIARNKGRHGWWDEKTCSIELLKNCLQDSITKGDMVDIMNFAAMIYARECADHKNMCEHDFVSADNEVCTGGLICKKCHEIKAVDT